MAAIVPEFVMELRSRSDSTKSLQSKMEEYMGVGVRLGLLIDPFGNTVWVYGTGLPVEKLDYPAEIDLSPELPEWPLNPRVVWK